MTAPLGKGGEQPEGVQLVVAEGLGRVVVTHGITLDLVPDPQVGKEQFTVGESARARITDANFLADKIGGALDTRVLTYY